MNGPGVQRFLDEQGRVTIWPSRGVDKTLVLAYLADQFAVGHTYAEGEVNEILKEWHTFGDWPLLRRSLVDSGFLQRDPAGLAYRRNEQTVGPEEAGAL